ncbi:MAG TPA: hypothetical protein VFY87_27950 [Geminicoccaceae bacterium]|nr:hypothetical protein [Geminicoccaceae bacterium]
MVEGLHAAFLLFHNHLVDLEERPSHRRLPDGRSLTFAGVDPTSRGQ